MYPQSGSIELNEGVNTTRGLCLIGQNTHSTQGTEHSRYAGYSTQGTVHREQYTGYGTQGTVNGTQGTVHSRYKGTVHSTRVQYTVRRVQYTVKGYSTH